MSRKCLRLNTHWSKTYEKQQSDASLMSLPPACKTHQKMVKYQIYKKMYILILKVSKWRRAKIYFPCWRTVTIKLSAVKEQRNQEMFSSVRVKLRTFIQEWKWTWKVNERWRVYDYYLVDQIIIGLVINSCSTCSDKFTEDWNRWDYCLTQILETSSVYSLSPQVLPCVF